MHPSSRSPTPVFHHSLGNTFQEHHDHRQTDYSLKQKLPPVTTIRNVTHSPPPHQKGFKLCNEQVTCENKTSFMNGGKIIPTPAVISKADSIGIVLENRFQSTYFS
ncbi:hypothetical protein E5288_WYG007208 [Bos mutus]|uniref:Uncharacterized protein n=1 Tax=Bos mutus TaxID=72004 RepID=A0A6B0QQB8_9CETA|nr:hypothetical protein [Bos mutus]